MSTYTSGPWHMHDMESATVCSGSGFAVADCNNPKFGAHESEANARLISAAPELLSALCDLYRVCRRELPDPVNYEMGAALAAIAKATGETK